MKKLYKLLIYTVILVLICVCFAGCAGKATNNGSTAVYSEDTELGTGSKTINVDVIADGKTVTFTINTDKETLGEALTEHNLISGEQGSYGMYVKVVNGITADYVVNQTYWSLSEDGEPLQTGVDSTKISDGKHYEITLTK